MLDINRYRPLIIYEHAEEGKRAWLVPTLSAVLHMAHIWARDKQIIGQLPVAEVAWDAGEAAYLVITEHSKNELRDPLETGKQYLVRDLISRLLVCLKKLLEVEAKARNEPRRTISLETSTKLYGWDLLGIARGDGNLWRQQLDLDQDWRILGRDLAVLYCQNIGELVKPAPSVRLCATANAAQLRQDRLIAPIKCLRWLSDKRGKPTDNSCPRIGKKEFWSSPGTFTFDDCANCILPRVGQRSRGTPFVLSSPRSVPRVILPDLVPSRRGTHKCAKQAQQILRNEYTDQKSEAPPTRGAIGFGTRKLQKSRLLPSDSSSLTQSQSSETRASSVSAAETSSTPPALEDTPKEKTVRKLRKHRPFHLLFG